jgi:hypothetical protein
MRYKNRFDQDLNRWVVIDTYVNDQVMGLHRNELQAILQAESQERHWSLFRSPAEDVALMMA